MGGLDEGLYELVHEMCDCKTCPLCLADRLKARCTAAQAQAQLLRPLVLAKTFRSELVPQDANDEPARAASTHRIVKHRYGWEKWAKSAYSPQETCVSIY